MIVKKHRFHGLGSVRSVLRDSQTLRSQNFALKYRESTKKNNYRCAVVVSKKVHKSAVQRNKIRRRIYELVRELEPKIINQTDFVIIAYNDELTTQPIKEVKNNLTNLLSKAKII